MLVGMTWSTTAAVNTIPAILVALSLGLLLAGDRPGAAGAAPGMGIGEYFRRMFQVVRNPTVLGLCTMAGLRTMAQNGLLMFLPLYLVDILLFSPGAMGAVMTAMQVAGIAAALLAGALSDRIGRRPIVMAGLGASTVIIAGLTLIGGGAPYVAGVALLMTFGRQGVLGPWLSALGLQVSFTSVAVVLAQCFVCAPFYIRSAQAGFQTVDRELEQVAYTLGYSPLRTFVRVTVPLAFPALLSGSVMAWARALGEFGATIMFAGNLMGRTQTMPLAIYIAMESDLAAALILSALLIIVPFGGLFLMRTLLRRGSLASYA